MTSKYNFIDYQKECETNIYFTIAVWFIMSQHQISPNWRKNIKKKLYTNLCKWKLEFFYIYEETSPLYLLCDRVCYMHLIFSFSYTWYLVKVICRCYCTVVVSFDKTIISLRVLPYCVFIISILSYVLFDFIQFQYFILKAWLREEEKLIN